LLERLAVTVHAPKGWRGPAKPGFRIRQKDAGTLLEIQQPCNPGVECTQLLKDTSMSSILTNTSAMVALQTLKGVSQSLSRTQTEISTGKTVSSARDNAAIWAISKVMESDVQGFKGIKESLSLGQSSVAVARTAAETITNLLNDVKGKIVAAQESNVDRGKIQTDIGELRNQIVSVVNAAQFNGLNLVDNEEMVNILSSLDRDGQGNVTARSISISGQGLGLNAAVAGTTASDALVETATVAGLSGGASGNVQVALTQDFAIGGPVDSNTETVTFNITATGTNDAEARTISVNGVDVSVNVAEDVAQDTLAAAVRTAIETARDSGTAEQQAALAGITVGGAANAVEITTTDRAEAVAVDFGNLDALAGVAAANDDGGGTTGEIAVSLEANALTVSVAGVDVDVTINSGMSAADVATALETAITTSTDPGLGGVTVERDGTTISITNVSSEDVDVDFGAVDALSGATVTGAGVTAGAATVESRAATLSLAGEDVALAGGDTFTITLGTGGSAQTFTYTLNNTPADTEAGRAAAFAEIATGLAEGITAATGLSASAEGGVVTIANTGSGALEFGIAAFTDGASGGRLNALAAIDVSTQEGAASALSEIEGLIQTAIDASATFGSAQGRIDNQTQFVNQLTDSLRAGIGTLVDADMEAASARLQALQVQQQLAIQSLSIANQQPQNILALFR